MPPCSSKLTIPKLPLRRDSLPLQHIIELLWTVDPVWQLSAGECSSGGFSPSLPTPVLATINHNARKLIIRRRTYCCCCCCCCCCRRRGKRALRVVGREPAIFPGKVHIPSQPDPDTSGLRMAKDVYDCVCTTLCLPTAIIWRLRTWLIASPGHMAVRLFAAVVRAVDYGQEIGLCILDQRLCHGVDLVVQ